MRPDLPVRPDLPWNVAGIPPEAREAARAAARREGLSIGEWLTRRILAGMADLGEARSEWPKPADPPPSRRDSEDMLENVSRSESDTADACRRIEEQLRGLARRIDASERSQTDSHRVMSKAAVEMNIAAREQAQAVDQMGVHIASITERLDRVEGRDSGEGLREAVKALHQGLSRLANQISQTANQSATQISSLAQNIENVAGRIGQARQETLTATQSLDGRTAQLDERVRTLEKSAQVNAGSLDRALEALEEQRRDALRRSAGPMEAVARLEDSVRRLETRGPDPDLDRRLAGIERTLAEVISRVEPKDEPDTVEQAQRKLMQRLDTVEAAQRETIAELRKAAERPAEKPAERPAERPAAKPAERIIEEPAPTSTASFSPLPTFDAPPFPDSGPPPFASTPGFAASQTPFVNPPFAEPAAPPFEAADNPFAAPPQETPAPTVDSYLAAARRSARAAAQAEAGNTGTLNSIRWGLPPDHEARSSKRTRPLLVGIVALVAIAVIAGAILSRRTANEPVPGSAMRALFENKAPAPAIKPTVGQAAPPAAAAPETATTPVVLPPPKPAAASPPAAQSAASHVLAAPTPPVKTAVAPQHAAPPPAPQLSQPAPQTAAQPARPAPPAAPLDRLTAAANAGNSKAELIVGLKYLDGDGVPVNEAEAAKWLQKAADAGEPVAQYRLGTLYERGRGVPADPAKATRWYLSAANQGSRKAMHNLAVAYAEGSGVKKDYAEASRWFMRAANLGLSDSQFNLAVLYERGLGVPQNLVDAYKWYAIAAAQGDQESRTRMGAIASQLSNDGRLAAQHAADLFHPGQLDARANVAPSIAEATRG